ncbi:MAG: GspE/PulE family protein [Alphaproteobacteria bacterium]
MGDLLFMAVTERNFADILRDRGEIGEAELARAATLAATTGEPLHLVLSKLGIVAEDAVSDAVAESLGLANVTTAEYDAARPPADGLSLDFLQTSRVLPLSEDAASVVVAMANPFDDATVRALELKLGKRVVRRIAAPFELDRRIARLLGRPDAARQETAAPAQGNDTRDVDVQRLQDMASEAPVIRLVNRMIEDAIAANASDIHIEPADGDSAVRYRVDGLLRPVMSLPAAQAAAAASRIKIMADLDIVDRRRAQDGRCRVHVQGRAIDIRISAVPTIHGEGLVLRILDKARAPLDLEQLGMAPDIRDRLASLIAQRSGIFLVTGPTGSGKTTTLYAALQRLNTTERKLVTVEDPVEYQLGGISQIQVNPVVGMGFSDMLRSVLRHDPDVIMVGEIRDIETARIAVQSALTGHVVLSTLHTNDAPGAMARLMDMGIEPFLIASALNGVMAQRLARALCANCKRPMRAPDEVRRMADALGIGWTDDTTCYEAAGCEDCGGTGYSGRTAIFELLEVTDGLRATVLDRPDGRRLRIAAERDGLRSLRHDGMRKVMAGLTTLEEVLRVTQEQ